MAQRTKWCVTDVDVSWDHPELTAEERRKSRIAQWWIMRRKRRARRTATLLKPMVAEYVLRERLRTGTIVPEYKLTVILAYEVPAGFRTDFGSVPRPIWAVLHPLDAIRAFVLHDWLYAQGITTRAAADHFMLGVMRDTGVPEEKRGLAYAGVRVGSWWAWRKHARRRARESREADHA